MKGITPWKLEDAMEAHLRSIAVGGRLSPATLKDKRRAIRRLIKTAGNVPVHTLDDMAMDVLFEEMSDTCGAGALNSALVHLGVFFKWCVSRKMAPLAFNPLAERKRWDLPDVRKTILPVGEFAPLLEAAKTPRDRMIVAIGLYLFLRASEIRTIQLRDLDLDRGTIKVHVWKSKKEDVMPISKELDRELRRWLTHYTEQVGPLRPDYYLTPSRDLTQVAYDHALGRLAKTADHRETLHPERQCARPESAVKLALPGIRWDTHDSSGKSYRYGCHLLRRSGGRALFDRLRTEGYEGALQRVKTMLHHKEAAMTEFYLDVSHETELRDELLRGQEMFPEPEAGNVVSMTERLVSRG